MEMIRKGQVNKFVMKTDFPSPGSDSELVNSLLLIPNQFINHSEWGD